MNTSSSLFRELTGAELAAITARCFAPLGLAGAELLSGGLFNTTYMLTLTDGQRLVLRAGPVNRGLLMDYERGMMRAEAHVYALCEERGIPVSHVRALDCSRTVIDRDYMIVDAIEGVAMSAIPEGERAGLGLGVGELTRRLHGITGERFGHVSQILAGGGYDTWRGAVLGAAQSWARMMRPLDMYSPRETDRVLRIYERFAPLMDAVTVPRLVHADLWTGNVLVSGAPGRRAVAALIDADRALFGDTDYEFTMSLPLSDEFIEGYGTPLDMGAAAVTRRSLYRLLHELEDSYVWLYQYNDRENALSTRQSALRRLEELERS